MSLLSSRHPEAQRRWPLSNPIVIDRAGLPVNVSGKDWHLNYPSGQIKLNWDLVHLDDSEILDAFKLFIVHELRTKAPKTVLNSFNRIRELIHTPAAIEAARTGAILPYLAFSQARESLGADSAWKLHDCRMFYRWSRSQRFKQFDADVETRIGALVFGGNEKGRAVRSRDIHDGPLAVDEVANIISALKAARLKGNIPIKQQAAIVLCLATGSNSAQYAAMRTEDLRPIIVDGVTTAYILDVPRHKKGHDVLRAEFRSRKLNTFFGRIIEDLCEASAAQSQFKLKFEGTSRPLFERAKPSKSRGNLDEIWLYHISTEEFCRLLQKAIKTLAVNAQDGNPLKVTTRRFRYTLATRMINNGASQEAIADALDHSDLQNVSVYWEINSDIVEHLDRAMTRALAPRAQALAGIVRTEADAVRGNDKGSRRFLADAVTRKLEPIGSCGSFSFCNINAPYACYTCVQFQAWMDGPHEDVLSQLLRAREERSMRKLDPKIIGIEDELILAVANVILRIEQMRQQDMVAND